MSDKLREMAWHTKVSTMHELLVLLWICYAARDEPNGRPWLARPLLACLMHYTKLSRRSVQRALAGLERQEILIREKRGPGETEIWNINIQKMGPMPPEAVMGPTNDANRKELER